MVSRVSTEQDLNQQMLTQLFGKPQAIFLSAGILAGCVATPDIAAVIATRNRDEILALDADVVIHAARLAPPYGSHDADIIPLLASLVPPDAIALQLVKLGYLKDEVRLKPGGTFFMSYGYNVWGAFAGQTPNSVAMGREGPSVTRSRP